MRDAGRSEDFVAIFGDEIVLAVVKRSDGEIAQDIIERPHQCGCFCAFEIFGHRTDEDAIKLLRERQGIRSRIIKSLAEIEDLFAQVGGTNGILARLHHGRSDEDDAIFVFAD